MQNGEVKINDKTLTCMFCGNNTFDEIKTTLNRRLLAMFGLEILNLYGKKSLGKAYICNRCGYKHEFFEDLPRTKKERAQELNPLS